MGLFKGDFYSSKLNMTTSLNIIFPEYSNDVSPVINDSIRVLYLLHGLGANCNEWVRFSKIEYYAKKYNFIVIMPEVNRSFYSNMEYGLNYYDYISDELPDICQKWFNIPKDRNLTFIAGESMGGYGAMKIALSKPNKFAAVASLSGVLDYKSLISRINLGTWNEMSTKELISIQGLNYSVNKNQDIFRLIEDANKINEKPRIIQICGREDFLYQDNLRFKESIEKLDFDFRYLEWEGDHSWPFWDVAIQKAMQFFLHLDIENTKIY